MLVVKSLVLPYCLLLFSGGCNPKLDPTGPRPAETLTATEIAGIRLTYMCGNTFRVRNPNDQEAVVTWDVYQKNETGSLTLPPKPAGALHSETFFTTVNKGTVRLFYQGQLIQTKANGNKPPCQTGGQQPADWPQLTELPILDTTKLLTLPNDTAKIFRTELVLAFDPEVGDSARQAILNRFGLTVIGVTWAKTFFVRFADRGQSIEAYRAFEDSLNAWPGIQLAVPINFTPLEEVADSRYPSDGAGQARDDWFTTSNATWAGRAIRSPLAWGCENGNYGGSLVPVGVLEWKHDRDHPEFAASSPTLWEPSDGQLAKLGIQPKPADTVAARMLHATQVVGTLSAEGDNGSGVAGAIWKTRLHLYAMYSSGNRPTDLITGFYQVTDRIRQDGVRVVSVSADGVLARGLTQQEKELQIDEVALYLREALNASPQLTIVVAAGNERFRNTYTAYVQTVQPAVIRSALLKLHAEAPYRDRILVVTGTQQNNAFWDSWYLKSTAGANYFVGSTDIAAPAQDIVTLDRRAGSSIPVTGPVVAGTSLSAPMVAGLVAQLLSMDPSLTPAQVKDYLIRGAQIGDYSASLDQYVPAAAIPVPGTSESVYQLNAYQALRLLSQERPGTPICGYEVALSGSNILLHRNPPAAPATVPVTGLGEPYSISVAQGGRLLSVSGFVDPAVSDERRAGEYRLQGGQWQSYRTLSGIDERTYLERDTLEIRWGVVPLPGGGDDSGPYVTLTRERGTSRQSLFLPALLKGNAFNISLGRPNAAPSGDWLAVDGTYFEEPCNPACITARVHLIRWSDLASTLVKKTNWDVLESGSQYTGDFYGSFNLLWSHSGLRLDALYGVSSQRAIDEFNTIEFTGSRLYSQPVSVAAGVTLLADQVVDNVVPMSTGYLSADDSVVFIDESPFQSSSCSRSRRQLTQLTTLIGATTGCFGNQYFPMGRLMAVLGNVSGRQHKAAGELKRRTLPAPAENRRALLASQAQRVRVN